MTFQFGISTQKDKMTFQFGDSEQKIGVLTFQFGDSVQILKNASIDKKN